MPPLRAWAERYLELLGDIAARVVLGQPFRLNRRGGSSWRVTALGSSWSVLATIIQVTSEIESWLEVPEPQGGDASADAALQRPHGLIHQRVVNWFTLRRLAPTPVACSTALPQ